MRAVVGQYDGGAIGQHRDRHRTALIFGGQERFAGTLLQRLLHWQALGCTARSRQASSLGATVTRIGEIVSDEICDLRGDTGLQHLTKLASRSDS